MSEAARAVLRFTRREVGKALAVALGLGLLPQAADAFRPHLFGGGAVVGGSSGLPTTMVLVNTSGSTAPANTVPTQLFGHVFKQGDVPIGNVVKFTVGGVSQPFSVGLQGYWPDGSLKLATFMLLPTFAIAGSGSQAVTISSVTGSWPAASSRTLTEVYNQGLEIGLPNYSSSYNGKSVSLNAYLNGDGNTVAGTGVGGGSGYLPGPVVWLDGAAGKAWKISTHLAQTSGGTADPTLAADHYIVALNNSSGGLGGYRWFGTVRQPWYNLGGTPTSGAFVFFEPPSTGSPSAGANWSVNPGGSGQVFTPLTWAGGDGNPLAAQAFSFTNALSDNVTCQTSVTNNYYFGAGINYQVIPVVFSGGSLPPTSTSPGAGSGGIAAGGFAFLGTASGSGTQGTQFRLFFNGGANAPQQYSFTGNGSGTVTPVPALWPGTRLSFATASAQYNFFQGTGSIASETTLRMQINQTYWQSARLFPPYNLSYQGASLGGAVPDTTFPFAFNPYNIGDIANYQPGVGDHSDIGMLPNMAVVDFYNQSVLSERLIRIIGLCGGLQPADFKDATTGTVVNLSGLNNYTGLPAASTSLATSLAIGYTPTQPAGWGAIGTTTLATEHEPNYSAWAYLRTGELQYRDFMTDIAVATVLGTTGGTSPPAARVMTVANSGIAASPGVYYAHVCGWDAAGGEYRSRAWANRDVQYAALLCPWSASNPTALDYDGTQTSKYLNDIADSNCNGIWDQFNTGTVYGAQASYVQMRGSWTPAYISGGTTTYGLNGPEWEFGDYACAMALGALRGNAAAVNFLTNVVSPRWNYIGTNYKGSSANGFWYLNDYSDYQALIDPDNALTNSFGYQMIGADDEWVPRAESFLTNVLAQNQVYIGWAPNAGGGGSGQAFTMTIGINAGNAGAYTPQNGDVLRPDPAIVAGGGTIVTWANMEAALPAGYWPSAWYYPTSPNQNHYIVGLTQTGFGATRTYTFDTALTIGGAPEAISNSIYMAGAFSPILLTSQSPPVLNEPTDFMLNIWQAGCLITALGHGSLGPIGTPQTLLWDINNRFANGPGGPFHFYNTGGGGGGAAGYEAWDVRYLTQPSYA
jgi:hypothetical protein